jgi:ribonuclease HI
LLEAAELIERVHPSLPLHAAEGPRLVMNIDGAARGNPGPAGVGVMIREEGGPLERELWEYIGEATNNVAEYEALLLALSEAGRLKAAQVTIRSDSELLVRQLEGRYRVKHPRLMGLHSRARELVKTLPSFQIEHVGRERNHQADALANRAIDEALAGSGRHKERT